MAAVSVTRTRSSPRFRSMGWGPVRSVTCVSLVESLPGRSVDPHDQGVALAAATAERSGADAAAATLQFCDEGRHDSGTGGADRMAEGDGPTVYVDPIGRDPEQVRRPQRDGCEGLVDLDHVEVRRFQIRLLQGEADGL